MRASMWVLVLAAVGGFACSGAVTGSGQPDANGSTAESLEGKEQALGGGRPGARNPAPFPVPCSESEHGQNAIACALDAVYEECVTKHQGDIPPVPPEPGFIDRSADLMEELCGPPKYIDPACAGGPVPVAAPPGRFSRPALR